MKGLSAVIATCTVLLQPFLGWAQPTCDLPEISLDVCTWTGACASGPEGCAERCLINVPPGPVPPTSFFTLQDRAYSEEFYLTCPHLAYVVNRALADAEINGTSTSGSKRLLLDNAGSKTPLGSALTSPDGHPLLKGVPKLPASASFQVVPVGDVGSDSSNGTDLPPEARNPCPESSVLSDPTVRSAILAAVAEYTGLIEATEQGQVVSGKEELQLEMSVNPNAWRLFLSLMADPDALEEYLTERCTSQVLQGPTERFYYFLFTETFDDDYTHEQCVDTFGALERYSGELVSSLVPACLIPFETEPSCFYGTAGLFLLSTPSCAIATAELFNISDPEPLLNVVEAVQNIHDECSVIPTQAACEGYTSSSSSQNLTAIVALHQNVPLRYSTLPTIPDGPPASSSSGPPAGSSSGAAPSIAPAVPSSPAALAQSGTSASSSSLAFLAVALAAAMLVVAA